MYQSLCGARSAIKKLAVISAPTEKLRVIATKKTVRNRASKGLILIDFDTYQKRIPIRNVTVSKSPS